MKQNTLNDISTKEGININQTFDNQNYTIRFHVAKEGYNDFTFNINNISKYWKLEMAVTTVQLIILCYDGTKNIFVFNSKEAAKIAFETLEQYMPLKATIQASSTASVNLEGSDINHK